MKKIKSLLIIFTLVNTISISAQTWEQVTISSFVSILNKIYFINSQIGWIAGEKGSIYKSTDGGQTWTHQENSCTQSLNSIFFLNDQKGYIVGDSRRILSTDDGGETWKEDSISFLDKKATLRSVFFKDSLNGWILASTTSSTAKGWILNTSDGGNNWNTVLTVNKELYNLSMNSSGNGLVCGKDVESFYYTKNGIVWQSSVKPELIDYNYIRKDIRSVQLVNDTIGYAVGYGSFTFAQPSLVLKTTNGGNTWKHIQLPAQADPQELLYDVYFSDENNGIAVGGISKGGAFLKTTDGGNNWTLLDVPFGSTIKSICGIGNKFWIVGNEGLIASSEDQINWSIICPTLNSKLASICFPTPKVGYAAGFSGTFTKTIDQGKTWKPAYISASYRSFNVNALNFISENTGFAAHSYGMVTKTTDGGETWKRIMKDTLPSFINYGLSFVNENFGVVVGKDASNSGIIYRTTDGGLNWDVNKDLVEGNFLDVAFRDTLNGIVVGENLSSLYTTDGGMTWNLSALPGSTPITKFKSKIRSVAFINDHTALAVGDSIIFKSDDDGASWQYLVVNSKVNFYKVAFEDEVTGYICGRDEINKLNEIWKTTNAGDSWINITDTYNFPPDFLFYTAAVSRPGLAFFAGNNGIIYKYETIINSVDNVKSKDMRIKLAQNYPNPFNPSTWIEYELPFSGDVKITVYNLLGQNIKTLVNGYFQRGIYKVNFDASTLASGIYYYTLQFGDNISSKKMQLLK